MVELNWTLLHFLFLKIFKTITVIQTKETFLTLQLSQATVPGSRAQMCTHSSHSSALFSPQKPLDPPAAHCDMPTYVMVSRRIPSGCPVQSQPYEKAAQTGVRCQRRCHKEVGTPAQPIAVGTLLPKRSLTGRVCNQGKRIKRVQTSGECRAAIIC